MFTEHHCLLSSLSHAATFPGNHSLLSTTISLNTKSSRHHIHLEQHCPPSTTITRSTTVSWTPPSSGTPCLLTPLSPGYNGLLEPTISWSIILSWTSPIPGAPPSRGRPQSARHHCPLGPLSPRTPQSPGCHCLQSITITWAPRLWSATVAWSPPSPEFTVS